MGRLYNLLGYIYRLVGRIQDALFCHREAEKIAELLDLPTLKISALFNTGLCKRDLAEYESAIPLFNSVKRLSEETNDYSQYAVYSQCCLAYLYSCLDRRQEALQFVQAVQDQVSATSLSSWGRGYSLLFLGSTYRNLGELEQAFWFYEQTMQFAQGNYFSQITAKAIHGIAQLHREQHNFDHALNQHLAAIELLDQLSAKCDLADAYYQLGLTYQQMENDEESRANFQNAIQLFDEMQAPKQVERVRQSMESSKDEG